MSMGHSDHMSELLQRLTNVLINILFNHQLKHLGREITDTTHTHAHLQNLIYSGIFS